MRALETGVSKLLHVSTRYDVKERIFQLKHFDQVRRR